ncbi:MAG: tRNA pseudouridine(38-40) synthase TruA [Verrucomicrobiales bacterium]|nr:tRNA pseudouridine(38-40) synthase TruA [Verrucomicrobiales bacterium]
MDQDPATALQRFCLTIAYDGRSFEGWQSQPGGNTIQDRLEAAIQSICPEIDTVQGSGRTDAGVSADGQVAHFDAPANWSMTAEHWQRAINTQLPPTIRIMKTQEVSGGFHARFSPESKTYCYEIWTGPVLPPTLAGLAWHRPSIGDLQAFQESISSFEGTHDFRAFAATRKDGKDDRRNTVRTISEATVEKEGDLLSISVTGNGFLYKMVRFLVGSAAEVARGKLRRERIEDLLKSGGETGKAPFCAPSEGLRLVKVRYPDLNGGS